MRRKKTTTNITTYDIQAVFKRVLCSLSSFVFLFVYIFGKFFFQDGASFRKKNSIQKSRIFMAVLFVA